MKIKHKNSGEEFDTFPAYIKDGISRYGYLIVTNDNRVLFVFTEYDDSSYNNEPYISFDDVTDNYYILIDDNLFQVVTWNDDVQSLSQLDGFVNNSHLINDEVGVSKYGSNAYMINTKWLFNNK